MQRKVAGFSTKWSQIIWPTFSERSMHMSLQATSAKQKARRMVEACFNRACRVGLLYACLRRLLLPVEHEAVEAYPP